MSRIPFSGLEGLASPGTIQIPDDYMRVRADPDAFGAGIGAAGQQFGRALENVGGELNRIAVQQRDFENQTAATDALNTIQNSNRQIIYGSDDDPNVVGYVGLRGKAAVDGYKGALQSLNDVRQTTLGSISNPAVRDLVDRQSRRMMNSDLEKVARHRQQQFQQYAADTNTAALALSERQAGNNFGDDAAFTDHLADGVRATEAALRAKGASDATVAAGVGDTIDAFWKQRVLRMAATDPLAADRMLQSNLDKLAPGSQTALLNHLRPLVDRRNASFGAQEALGTAGPASGAERMGGRASGASVIPPEQREGLVQQAVSGTMVPAPLMAGLITQESGWDAKARGGSSDFGLGQVLSSTRRDPGYGMEPLSDADAADPAKNARWSARYLEARGKALGVLTPADWQDERKVTRALQAYNGGGDPNYAQNVLGHVKRAGASLASGDGGGPKLGPPDLGGALERFNAIADRDGYSFEARRSGESIVHSEVARQTAITHDARVALQKRAGDVNAALADGRDVQALDENGIRRAFPVEQAEPMIRAQREARESGLLMKQIEFASQADLQRIAADLDSGTGPVSAQQRARIGARLTPAPDGTMPDPNTDPEDYRRRRDLGNRVAEVTLRRNERLLADPAGFAMRDPAIRDQVLAGLDPKAPKEQRATAIQTLLSRQEYFGVPEEKRRALPAAIIASDVDQLSKVDPAQADMGLVLAHKAAFYGDAWSSVFGSYVRAGLSQEYRVLGIMTPRKPEDADVWAADRADFQRALVVQTERGGLAKLREAVGKEAARSIDDEIDTKMAGFKASVIYNRDAIQMFDQFRDSVRTLAYYKSFKGDSSALENAFQSIIGKRYDFYDTMRVPKGMLYDVRAATRDVMNGITKEDLPVLRSSTPGLAPDDARKQLFASIRANAKWVPTSDDSGLQLTVLGHDNVPITLTRGGEPIIVRFDQVGPAARPVHPDPTELASDFHPL